MICILSVRLTIATGDTDLLPTLLPLFLAALSFSSPPQLLGL